MHQIVVSAAIIQKDGKILVAQRKHDDALSCKWEFPGGKLEEGESIEECMKRELYEEFSIETKVVAYLGESNYRYHDKYIQLKGFFVEHISGEFQLKAHESIKWVSISELSELDWAPADVELVNQLLEHYNSK